MRVVLNSLATTLLAAFSVSCFSVAKLHPERPADDSHFGVADHAFTVRGTKFLVVTDQSQSEVHLEVRYIIGADQDPVGKEGLAHVVEHLLFEVPIGDLDDADHYGRALSRVSLSWNAFTTLDTTSYLTTLNKKNLVSVLNLEMMRSQRGCRGLSEETFLREREVVRNEARERDLGGPSIADTLSEFIYKKGHPYRRSVIGTDATLTSLTLSDACEFMAKHYHSNNRLIVVSGPVSPREVSSLANVLVGPALPDQKTTDAQVAPVIAQRSGETVDLDIDTPIVIATWRMEPLGSEAYRFQQQVLGGFGAALRKAAKNKDWVRGIGVTRFGGQRAPAMVAYVAVADAAELSRAEALIDEARKKTLAKKGKYIHSYLLQRQLILQYENQEERTGLFADYLQFSEKDFRLARHISELEETKEEEIAAVANSLLDRPGRSLRIRPNDAVYVRENSSFAIDASPPRQQNLLDADTATVEAANRALPIPTHVGAKQKARRYHLPNGLTLVFWENKSLPLVHGRLILPIGASDVSTQYSGLSNLLPGSDRADVTVFSETSMSKNADGVMYRLAHEFKRSSRITSERDMQTLAESLSTEETAASELYQKQLKRAIYGKNHPYTRTSITRESLPKLSKGAVSTWAKKHRTVRGATLILTGRFDPELMYRLALYYFGEANDAPLPTPETAPPLPNQGAVVHGYDESKASLGISLSFRGEAGAGIDMPARQLLAMVISNRMQQLRESQALTYNIHARFVPNQDAGVWHIQGDVDPARGTEAMQSLLLVIAELRASPGSYVGEFANARSKLMAGFSTSKPSAAAAANRLTYLTALKLEDDYYEHYVRALARVVPSDLEALLKGEFEQADRVIGLFGPRHSVSAAKKVIESFVYVAPDPKAPPESAQPDTRDPA